MWKMKFWQQITACTPWLHNRTVIDQYVACYKGAEGEVLCHVNLVADDLRIPGNINIFPIITI